MKKIFFLLIQHLSREKTTTINFFLQLIIKFSWLSWKYKISAIWLVETAWWGGGGGLVEEMGGCHFFITLQFNCIDCVGGGELGLFYYILILFSLLSWPYKILIQDFIVLKQCVICIFLIHSDSVQKMSTALFI